MTGVDKIKEVRQLKYINGFSIREISRRTNLSRNTVRKILRTDETKLTYQRENIFYPVRDSVKETIEAWVADDLLLRPKNRRTAVRMYQILRDEHGYSGSYDTVLRCMCQAKETLKPEQPEAYIPLEFGPAESFQFDWSQVTVYIGTELMTLQLGIVVLCHSRYFYARGYYCQKQELMLDLHRRAFEFFGGGCRRGIYDNLKTAVKEILKGKHRNLQERFVRFCSHYLFEPNFCNPARGNEKGRVESKIGYVKRNFFIPIPRFESIEEMNECLLRFCLSKARLTAHPDIAGRTSYQVYEQEKDKLVTLPGYGFECCRIAQAVVSATSTVSFETNRYSVPTEHVNKTVQVKGYADEVAISYQGREIARHRRIYDKGRQVYSPYHYLSILAKKPRAFTDGKPFKGWQLPEVFDQYRRLLNGRHEDGDIYFARTLILLKDYSLKEVTEAVKKAVSLQVLSDSYILALLRQTQEPGTEEHTSISIKVELSKYRAGQKPLSEYDNILRFPSERR